MHFDIDEPCDEPWEAMSPRPDGRHCPRCDKTVIDLSGMTRAQAEARVARTRGDRVCVQLAYDLRTDEVLFRPPPSRAPHWAGGLVLVAALGGSGCAGTAEAESPIVSADERPSDEPCAIGEPMVPIADAPIAPAEIGPVATDLATATGPTAEQLELTRQKQEAAAATVTPMHHIGMRRGGMMRRP